MVQTLIKHGADLEARCLDDKTPLLTAIFRNKHVIVKMLLEAGAKLDYNTRNPALQEGLQKMSPAVKEVIEAHVKWLRLRDFLLFHKNKDLPGSGFPEAFKALHRNHLHNIITEYM